MSLPVPLSVTVCDFATSLWFMVSVPERVPPALGLNTTEIAQFAPAATRVQSLLCEKSPLEVTLVTTKALVPLFEIFTLCDGDAVFTICDGNVNAVTDSAATGGGTGVTTNSRFAVCLAVSVTAI